MDRRWVAKGFLCYWCVSHFIAAQNALTWMLLDPATQEEITTNPEFDAKDTQDAIAAAAAALPSYRKTTPRQRAGWLRKWYELMMENIDDLAKIITAENGKPTADAKTEVAYAAGFLQWFAEEAPRIYGDTIVPSNPDNRLYTVKQPIGVCALIVPWNFPAAMITRKAGPALAAGCTVVVKAPAEAPLSALALADLAHRAGIPKGVINVITALDNTIEVGKVLTTNPIIKKVSFTGSTAVGKLLMNQSSSTLKKLSFELGGNAPFIVFEDADLNIASKGLIACKFRISGQTCVCANRIFVHRSIHDKFVCLIAGMVQGFTIGNGFDEGVTHGPLIHGRAIQKVDAHVKDAVSKGAKVVHGGKVLSNLGPNFYETTILTGMKSNMQLFTEETFGPVAALFVFDTEEEVINLANASEVGLAGYFFSKDNARCWRVAEALEVGMVGVNTGKLCDTISSHTKG